MNFLIGTIVMVVLAYLIAEPMKLRNKALVVFTGITLPLVLIILFSLIMIGFYAPYNPSDYTAMEGLLTESQIERIKPSFAQRWGASLGKSLAYTFIGLIFFIVIFIRSQFKKISDANLEAKGKEQ